MLQECRNCGAQIEYSADIQSLICPYCETVNVIKKPEDALPVDPEFIIPLTMTPDTLEKNVYGYLAQGDYTPDDMLESIIFLRRESFYVPVYTFKINYEVNWTASFGYDQREPYTAHRAGKAYTAYRTVTEWRPVSGRDSGTFELATYAGVDLKAAALSPVEIVPLTVLQGKRTKFNPAFMQGLRAEAFAVPEKLAYTNLNEEVARNITHSVKRHAQGNHQRDWNWNPSSITPSTSTLYVPICYAVFDYKGQNYHYWSDGLAGESVKADPLPVDEARKQNVRKGYIPAAVSFAGIILAAFYTRNGSAFPEQLLHSLFAGMIGPLLAFGYALIRRASLLGYSRRLRKSILAQMQASSASAFELDDKEKQALAKTMQRPVKSLLGRTELDKMVLPVVSTAAFLAAFLPSLSGGGSPVESTATAAKTPPATRPAPAGQTSPPAVPAQPVQQTPAQPEAPPQAVQAPAPSQDAVNRCSMQVFQAELSKSENVFIQQNLKSRELDINSANVQFNVKETADSTGGREFKCTGQVNVVSKSTNIQVLSYDIAYRAYAADGSSGIDQKTIARTGVRPPAKPPAPAPVQRPAPGSAQPAGRDDRPEPVPGSAPHSSQQAGRREPAPNQGTPSSPQPDRGASPLPKPVTDILKIIPKGKPPEDRIHD